MNVIRKYFEGYMNPETMKDPGWLDVWITAAQSAVDENCRLVVFKVPKSPSNKIDYPDSHFIHEIEFTIDKEMKKRNELEK